MTPEEEQHHGYETFESFYFNHTVNGREYSYRLTCNNGTYKVEGDGIFIAELSFFEDCKASVR